MDPILILQAIFKPLVLLSFAGFGIFLLASALGQRLRLDFLSAAQAPLVVGCAFGLALVAIGLHSYFLLVSVALSVAIFAVTDGAWRSRKLLLAAVGVVIMSVSLAWWLSVDPQPSGWFRAVAFALVVYCVQAGLMRPVGSPRRNWLPVIFLLFALSGFALLANTTMYQPHSDALKLLLLHQGEYIGAALHIRAGLVPFFDIPLQYGLGPTLAISAVCRGSNCWPGMSLLMVSTTLVRAVLIVSMALATRVARGNLWRATVALVVFAAVFLWPGFPFMGNIPAASPSVGGLRFLPPTLIAFLLFFRKNKLATAALVPGVLWSPEVAAMCLVIFGVHETARIGFIKAAIRSIIIAGGSMVALVVVHHQIYGVWIQQDVFTEYIRHVPTPYPINPFTNFVVLLAAFGLAAWNVYRQPADRLAFRQDLVVSALLFTATSYYLGRSHPNNVCNLMPFIVLVALRSLDTQYPARLPSLQRLIVLGISVASAAITLAHWGYVPFAHGFSMDTRPLVAAASQVDADILEIRARISNPDHLGIADLGSWNRNPAETIVWTAADPGDLFRSIPSDRRQLYIKRSAARLHLPGWIILGEAQRDWVDDFRVAYRITEQTSYKIQSAGSKSPGTYVVALLIPLDEVGRK